MGILGRIFGTKETNYSMDDAMNIIESRLASMEAEKKEENAAKAEKIRPMFRDLEMLVEEFSKKDIPERAKSSANVKERFCSIALGQVRDLESHSGSPAEFLESARETISSLGGLTKRQMAHMDFFFKSDLTALGKKMGEIDSLLKSRDDAADSRRAVALRRKLKQLDENEKSLKEKTASAERELSSAKKVLESTPAPELGKPDDTKVRAAYENLSRVRQEIDSLVSVQKSLKKYLHETREKNSLAESYIKSPSEALMDDEEIGIIGVAEKMSEAGKAGKVEVEESKIGKILGSREYLREKRLEIMRAKGVYDSEKNSLEKRIEEARKEYDIKKEKRDTAEARLVETSRHLEEEKSGLDSVISEKSRVRAELLLQASKILDASVS